MPKLLNDKPQNFQGKQWVQIHGKKPTNDPSIHEIEHDT